MRPTATPCTACGLRDVFDSSELEALAGDVRRIQGLDQDGEGAEVPSQEDLSQDIPPQGGPGPGRNQL